MLVWNLDVGQLEVIEGQAQLVVVLQDHGDRSVVSKTSLSEPARAEVGDAIRELDGRRCEADELVQTGFEDDFTAAVEDRDQTVDALLRTASPTERHEAAIVEHKNRVREALEEFVRRGGSAGDGHRNPCRGERR